MRTDDTNMPWNQKTWLDTFVKNKAFETHAMSLIVAMNEKRIDDRAEEERLREHARLNALSYASTVRMLLGLKTGDK